MIIYNSSWLKHLIIQDQMKKAYQAGDLRPEELQAVLEKYPVGFHSSNLFLRIGIFVVTVILTSFAFGLLSLMLSSTNILESPTYYLFLGLCSYIALEIAVRQYHHYKSGVDDALMWTTGLLLLVAYCIFIDLGYNGPNHFSMELRISGFIFVLGSFFTLRFANILMALITFCAFVAFIFFGWYNYGLYPLSSIPFLIIIVSLAVYFFAVHLDKRHWIYKDCLGILQVASLLTTYAAGNYFVVRELGSSMNNVVLTNDQGIPFGWFFWFWTIGIPLLYIGIGLRKKEVILLRSGLILVTISAITFKNYYQIMPIETALVICGALFLGLSFGVMHYLKTPKHGFTAEELDNGQLLDKLKVESLIVSGTFSEGPIAPQGSRMGGGSFGGGGATGDF